jgi:hypothetical protein
MVRTDANSDWCMELMVYDTFTDTVVRASPQGGSGVIATGTYTLTTTDKWARKPNWVSMSPRGDRFQMGWARAYEGEGIDDYYGTPYECPHTCSAVDFTDWRQCSVDQTHGGWCWSIDPNDRALLQAWASQNNRLDDHVEVHLDISQFGQAGQYRTVGSTLTCQTFVTADPTTNGRRQMIALSGTWNNAPYYAHGDGDSSGDPGVHFTWCMSGRRAGFFFMCSDGEYAPTVYGFNNILCFRISDARLWRVASLPHQHVTGDFAFDRKSDYFTETQWAIDAFGLNLHGTLNWQLYNPAGSNNYNGDPRAQDNVYRIQLDGGWHLNAIWS